MPPKSDIVMKYITPGLLLANRYRIEQFIGAGAYGAIFSAIDTTTMERVAVKAIPPRQDGVNNTAHGRFQREMKVISSLRHSNIITLYDFGQTDERIVFMVLEFIDGETLLDVVNRHRMAPDEALSVLQQIAMALREAHSKGIVHRDLKPQNVMLSRDVRGGWSVKVLDFGMAKVMSRLGDESIVELTRQGVAVGTPRYIAPEQARGRDVGPHTDIYALGLLFYEMFTGARAVKADSIEGAIIAHVSPEPLQLDEIDMVPRSVQPIMFKMMAKRIEDRYGCAEEILRDIERLSQSMSSGARTVPVGENAVHAGAVLDDGADMGHHFGGGGGAAPSKAKPAGQAEPRSLYSVDNLEVDFDRVARVASPKPKKVKLPRTASNGMRIPLSTVEWVETAALMVLAFLAFTLVTARLYDVPALPRLAIGTMPLMLAFGAAWVKGSSDWRNSPVRYMIIVAGIMIVGVHAMGFPHLALGLLRDGAWYLEPLQDTPVFSSLYDGVYTGTRWWAGKLAEYSPETRRVLLGFGG